MKQNLAKLIKKFHIFKIWWYNINVKQNLISNGKGLISIPAELTEEFKQLLIPYYEGKDDIKIKKFIKEKCYMSI